jgi:TolB-like protein
MIRFKLLAGVVTLMGLVCIGAAPTTAPSQPPPASVTANSASYSSVLVLPFAPVAGASDWIGKGNQEDLATELVRQSRLDVLTPADAQAVSDAAIAAQVGRDKGASLVAFGTYQIQDTDVRINGQLIDTASGKPLAALKATGPRRDLFHMEDLLAAQAVASLPPASVKLGSGAYASNDEATAPPAAGGNSNATQQYNSQGYYVTPGPDFTPTYNYGTTSYPADTSYDGGYSPYYTQSYPYNDYPYDYSGYGYGYPFWGDGFLFIGGGFGRGHFHDRGHDGHWYNGTESHHLGGYNGFAARSPDVGERSTVRSFGEGSFRSAPTFRGSVSSGGFHSAGGFGGFHGGGNFGGGFHGGGGGHR